MIYETESLVFHIKAKMTVFLFLFIRSLEQILKTIRSLDRIFSTILLMKIVAVEAVELLTGAYSVTFRADAF